MAWVDRGQRSQHRCQGGRGHRRGERCEVCVQPVEVLRGDEREAGLGCGLQCPLAELDEEGFVHGIFHSLEGVDRRVKGPDTAVEWRSAAASAVKMRP